MHNRRTKKGHPQEYWNCGSKKKKQVPGKKCPVGGTISQKALEKACCEVLGLSEFDETVFLEKVDHIEVPEKYTLHFFLKDGTEVTRPAPNTGHQDCWTSEYRALASKNVVSNRMRRERQSFPAKSNALPAAAISADAHSLLPIRTSRKCTTGAAQITAKAA